MDCVVCKKETTRLRFRKQNKDWCCSSCYPVFYEGSTAIGTMVNLEGYGNISQARLNALNSWVQIPGKDGVDKYGCPRIGQRTSSGKILDRRPDISG